MLLRTALSTALICASLYAQEPAPVSPPDSTKLTLVKSERPVYPHLAEENLRQGEVLLQVHIGADGSVQNATIVSGAEIFQRSAIDCVKKWKFAPYFKDGKPVEVNTEIPIDFILSKQ